MTCSVEGCTRDECSRGLCRKHYDMVRYHGRIVKPVQKKKLCFMCGTYMTCSVEGCTRDECSRGLCRKHYDMVRYHGRIVKPVQKKKLCFMCGTYFDVGNQAKDFCGAACRMRYGFLWGGLPYAVYACEA